MFRFLKKLNHPIVDVVLIFILAVVLFAVGRQSAEAAEPNPKPMVSLKKLEKKANCKKATIQEDHDFGEFHSWDSFQCTTKSGRRVWGENFLSLRHQAIEVTTWELTTFEFSDPWFMARCRGYNIFPMASPGRDWASRWVRTHKKDGCKLQLIDGLTYSRKAA